MEQQQLERLPVVGLAGEVQRGVAAGRDRVDGDVLQQDLHTLVTVPPDTVHTLHVTCPVHVSRVTWPRSAAQSSPGQSLLPRPLLSPAETLNHTPELGRDHNKSREVIHNHREGPTRASASQFQVYFPRGNARKQFSKVELPRRGLLFNCET